MFVFFIFIIYIALVIESFVLESRVGNFTPTHINKELKLPNYTQKLVLLYSKNDENKLESNKETENNKELESKNELENNKELKHNKELKKSKNDEYELVEFIKTTPSGDEGQETKFMVSRRLWKLLTALLAYRSKFGDYKIESDFEFKKSEKDHLSGYKLGKNLGHLIRLINLQQKGSSYIKIYREKLRRKNRDFLDSDLLEAPKLLWLLGFSTRSYVQESKFRQKLTGRDNLITSKASRLSSVNRTHLKDGDYDSISPDNIERITKVKKIVLENMLLNKQRMREQMPFKYPQILPEPTNKATPKPDILRKIVNEILDKNRATCPLIKRDTRAETEGAYHYAFFHWTFEQVLQALVLFNDMYYDYNKELLIKSESAGEEFNPITFNTLKSGFRVPENENWPPELHGMPLGLFVEKFRVGDIDAKEHWLRRPILDHIGFNWGDGINYLTFTWDKLEKGLIWYINYRGFPIKSMGPDLLIPKTTTVAKFYKPEEIQGMKIGRIVYMALNQIQMIKRFHRHRYNFLDRMGLVLIPNPELDIGYKPVPHIKFNKYRSHLMVSPDKKYLFDDVNEPPDYLKDSVTKVLDKNYECPI
uniref:Uncharacterized protein n=1 Tax=Theileria annulata TaxID=5874 RepID=A0A3B0MR68_THEAN